MPLVKIEVRRSWSPEQQQAIIEAIFSAQCAALKVPGDDRQARYIEHSPDLFHVPPGKTENFTLVEIAQENWGIRGGIPASDLDLGFKVDV